MVCLYTVRLKYSSTFALFQIKKRYNNKPPGAKKSGGSKTSGNTTHILGGAMGGQMHVIAPEESADEGSGAESYATSQERRSDMLD